MTKKEILTTIDNHKGDIRRTFDNLTATLQAMASGAIPAQYHANIINGLKAAADFTKGKADEIKSALGQWPEQE